MSKSRLEQLIVLCLYQAPLLRSKIELMYCLITAVSVLSTKYYEARLTTLMADHSYVLIHLIRTLRLIVYSALTRLINNDLGPSFCH